MTANRDGSSHSAAGIGATGATLGHAFKKWALDQSVVRFLSVARARLRLGYRGYDGGDHSTRLNANKIRNLPKPIVAAIVPGSQAFDLQRSFEKFAATLLATSTRVTRGCSYKAGPQ
jgi:hypothetical protein